MRTSDAPESPPRLEPAEPFSRSFPLSLKLFLISMADALHALDYLDKPQKYPPAPVCVVYGDEPLLKREAMQTLRREVLGEDEGDFSLNVLTGRDAQPRDVFDELATVALFGSGRRMVIIEEADDFVTRFRSELETYVAHPKMTGVLVLDVKSWASNTRLYKALDESGLQIQCKLPTPAKLAKWLVQRTKKKHQATLDPSAAQRLMEMVEPDLGLLDQELARLALLARDGAPITPEMVDENVGSWRTKTTWDLIDAAANGEAREALQQLDRLLLAGEQPIALLGQIASTLRRFACAARLVQQAELAKRRPVLRPILEQAGFKKFVLDKAEKQLRQIGRDRAKHLYHWLLQADLALKGSSSAPDRARLVLEQLIVRLSTQADPRRTASKS